MKTGPKSVWQKMRNREQEHAPFFPILQPIPQNAGGNQSLSHRSPPGGLGFSLFFFLHFQGLKMRPRLASLLLRLTGGVRIPETRISECSAVCWSITSTTENSYLKTGCRQNNQGLLKALTASLTSPDTIGRILRPSCDRGKSGSVALNALSSLISERKTESHCPRVTHMVSGQTGSSRARDPLTKGCFGKHGNK